MKKSLPVKPRANAQRLFYAVSSTRTPTLSSEPDVARFIHLQIELRRIRLRLARRRQLIRARAWRVWRGRWRRRLAKFRSHARRIHVARLSPHETVESNLPT